MAPCLLQSDNFEAISVQIVIIDRATAHPGSIGCDIGSSIFWSGWQNQIVAFAAVL